jgi:hypothetical protein
MTLQLHRPDGKGGVEPRPVSDRNWQNQLRSSRWGVTLRRGKLPALRNTEMNPTSAVVSVAFWVGLGVLTFVLLVAGYGTGFWG